ncbi:MAG: two-component regulator propeller domain-containing protein, partial [Balneolaceae bacterium]|nr:two-component regulator propeller domain-containing protein [Balneolaceae bacterium]
MMKGLYHLFISIVVLFSFHIFEGNAQDIKFRHLTIDDGLSQNAVYSILQDSRGFMWFGTKDGLNRYDGRNFVVYQHNSYDSTAISDAFVMKLFEDSRGRIWTGSQSGEINVFYRETDFFQRISLLSGTVEKINSNEITGIAERPDGSIWIGTIGDGLIGIFVDENNENVYSFEQYLNDPANDRSLSSNVISNLLVDENGTLWVGTDNGLNEFHADSKQFTRTIFETKHPDAPQTSGDYKICSMHLSRKGDDFWIGTQSGMVKFDRHSGHYDFYPHKYEVHRYGWGSVSRIAEDNMGQFWLGTAVGLMRFDPSNKLYTYYQHDPLNPQSLSHNLISSIFVDKTGNLWAGTSGLGINILDFKSNRFPTFARTPDPSSRITGFSIRSILEDASGDIWISADVLYRWNRETGDLKSFETSSDRPDDFGNTDAYSMIQASDGNIWVASARGLFRHNPVSSETRLYQHTLEHIDGQYYPDVNAVFEDQDSIIWIATRNHFSKMLDKEAGTFQHFRYNSAKSTNDTPRPVIFQDVDGIFWIGMAEGLVRFDPSTETFSTYQNNPDNPNSLSNNHIKSILADPVQPERYLWVGTSGGLNKFDYRTGIFDHYTEQDGLPNEVIYGILPDDDGNIWLRSNKGLSRFNPQAGTFRNFDVHDGLQSNEFNTGAYFRSESGELFFGGIQGLNYFFPDEIKDNPHQPPVVLTGLKIGDQAITYKSNPDLLQATVSEIDKLNLSYHDDVITFEFASLDFSAPYKNQYAYKLDGYNEDWISSGNLASATYTNLPHGEYVFRVKGSNNDGVWNEEGLSLAVIVSPPWWHTWWAYGFYAALFLSILYGARRYELNRFNLKNQLEIEKVQTDTLRNLDQLKSHFFANISHEFRTPLTLIIGQIENLLESDVDVDKKKKLQSVNKNAERLLTLINQLLDLSKLEAGKMELQSEQLNIVSFLKNLLFSFESLAETKNIALNFSSPLATILVDFDADKMEKVFFNLFSNAFKFTEPGGRIDVALEILQKEFVEISIKDSGVGIPEDRLSHIFDRFYQADPSNTRKYEGTGIGLSLAHELIKLHNGKIDVNSKIGVGTEFIIQLPIEENQSTTQNKSIPREGKSVVQDTTPTSMPNFNTLLSEHDEIILIVEDNKGVRTFIREQFENDYKILEAANGVEGISMSQETIPDLIITDLMMPEMDGYHFSKTIRSDEKTSHIPIIMLTAKAGQDPKIEGLEIGIDAYLTKPFHVKELQTRVKTLIQQRKNLKEQFSNATYFKPSAVTKSSVDQNFLKNAIEIIETHLCDEDFRVEHFAESLNMSISQLNRKLNALIDQPAGTFI